MYLMSCGYGGLGQSKSRLERFLLTYDFLSFKDLNLDSFTNKMVFPAFECGGPSQLMARITVHVKVTFGSKKC